MTRNLKPLGLALVAVFAMSALAAQGASATVIEHEFHSDGQKTVVTGTNSIVVGTDGEGKPIKEVSNHEFTVGTSGIVKCTSVSTESTQVGEETVKGNGTWATDSITVVPKYTGCTFGGNAATVTFHHCAYTFDSDTTEEAGTPTTGAHANVTIECKDNPITIATSVCTITVGPQEVKHAVSYENDPHSTSAVKVKATAHGIVVGNLNDKPGCVLLPKGAVGKYTGTTTGECFRDDGSTLVDTEKTTPPATTEGPTTKCTVSNL